MRIGVIAERTGVSRDTVRLYEKMGMLINVSRPHKYNNYKEYSEENIDRIKLILTLKNLGLSLKECKEVIVSIEDGEYNREFQSEFISSKLKEIDAKIRDLKNLKKILTQYGAAGCDNESIVNKIKR